MQHHLYCIKHKDDWTCDILIGSAIATEMQHYLNFKVSKVIQLVNVLTEIKLPTKKIVYYTCMLKIKQY